MFLHKKPVDEKKRVGLMQRKNESFGNFVSYKNVNTKFSDLEVDALF